MSLTKTALKKLGQKAADKHRDRKDRQCPARPDGRTQCRRVVKAGAGADATCGKEICALWMLSQDEDTAKALLGL